MFPWRLGSRFGAGEGMRLSAGDRIFCAPSPPVLIFVGASVHLISAIIDMLGFQSQQVT